MKWNVFFGRTKAQIIAQLFHLFKCHLSFPPRAYKRRVVRNSGLSRCMMWLLRTSHISVWQLSMAFRVGLGPRWRPVNAHIPSVSRSLGFHRQYFWNGVPLGPWITHLNAVTTWCVVHCAHQSSTETPRESCICSLCANTTNHFIFKSWVYLAIGLCPLTSTTVCAYKEVSNSGKSVLGHNSWDMFSYCVATNEK